MKKLTRGAVAIAAGTALLMSGAGSLAYWQSSAGTNTATFNTGKLDVTAGSDGAWADNGSPVTSDTTIVPGDTLTYTQTFTIDATGTNLYAQAQLDPGALTAGTDSAWATQLASAATYTLVGTGIAASTTAGTFKITPQSSPITATLTVTIPWDFGTTGDQSGAGDTLDLAATTVTVTQMPPPPPPPAATCTDNGDGSIAISATVPDGPGYSLNSEGQSIGTYTAAGNTLSASYLSGYFVAYFVGGGAGTYTLTVTNSADPGTIYAATTVYVTEPGAPGDNGIVACGDGS